MKNEWLSLFVMAVLLVSIDMVYIGLTRKWYENQVVTIQRVAMNIKPIGAVVCYFFLVLGIWHFILSPYARVGKKREEIVLNAVILGLVIYGVYSMTVYAVLKKWRPTLAAADTVWGGALFGLTSWAFLSLGF